MTTLSLPNLRSLAALSAALTALGAVPLHAQGNLLVNGDFELGSAIGWTQTGSAAMVAVQPFDVTGLGATQAFGANVSQTRLGLSQQVPLAAGVHYLLRADVAGDHPYSFSNADGGQWDVLVGGNSIGSGQLGGINAMQTLRQHVCLTFTVPASGPTIVELQLFRAYNASGVRNWLDNVELLATTLPTVCIRDPRAINTTVNVMVTGTPAAAYAVFVSPGTLPAPVPLPGFAGALRLDPRLILQLASGTLDAAGTASFKLPLPNDPFLVGQPLYFQGVEVGAQPSLGSLHYYPLIR